jgi:hypothetical protein
MMAEEFIPRDKYEYILGKVTKAELGIEDHGSLAVNLEFRLGNGVYQGLGWRYIEGEGGSAFLGRLLRVFGPYTQFEDVVGRTVYVLRNKNSIDSLIVGLDKLETEENGRLFIFDLPHLGES